MALPALYLFNSAPPLSLSPLPVPTVLRCRLPGRPTADCLLSDVSRDGVTALKVGKGYAGWGDRCSVSLNGG